MRRIFLAVILVVACATGTAADSFEDARITFQRGDYALEREIAAIVP